MAKGQAPTLTLKQQSFVDYYLDVANKTTYSNGAQSAIAAGYSVKTAKEGAAQLLNKAYVQEAIEKKRAHIVKKSDISREFIVEQLKEILTTGEKESARVSAAAELNKMCGFNAPVKSATDITSGGKQLTAVVYFPVEEN